MARITIRGLEPSVVAALKTRAATAGHSMEQEARTILTNAVENEQLARQRAALKKLAAMRKKIFGDKVFPDSTPLICAMRDELI